GPGADQLSGINLGTGDAGINYNFGEAGAAISGFVYVDKNSSGTRDTGDPPLAGVSITLQDDGGVTVGTTTTAADDSYHFTGLIAGTYAVFEGATPGYTEASNNVGIVNGAADGTTGPGADELSSIALGAGQGGINYNFGEV